MKIDRNPSRTDGFLFARAKRGTGSIPSGSTISTPWETKGFSFAGLPATLQLSPSFAACAENMPAARRLRLKGMQGAVIHPGAWRVQPKS